MSEENVSDMELAAEDEERAKEAGWGRGAVRAVSFWLVLVAVLLSGLVGGTALGVYVVPPGNLPGDPDYQADLALANAHIVELEEDTAAQEEIISSIDENIARADIVLELQNVASALLYTLRAPESGGCADFLGFKRAGAVQSMQMSQIYPC